MDSYDRKILNILRLDARISNLELSRRVHLSPAAVLERVRRLKEKGVIRRFETRLDAEMLGLGLTVFIELTCVERVSDNSIGRKLMAFPEIVAIYDMSGPSNYLLKVLVPDTRALQNLMQKIGRIKGVTSSRTTLVLDTIKEESAPCLAEQEPDSSVCRNPSVSQPAGGLQRE